MAPIFKWPAESGLITQRFLERPESYKFPYTGVDGKRYTAPGHEGLDIAATLSSNIFACADGTVSEVRLDGNTDVKAKPYGNQIRLKHVIDNVQYETIYAHLHEVKVQVGQTVKAGEIIGLADSTGNSTGHHLHLTVKKQGASLANETPFKNDIVNPLDYLEPFGGTRPAPGRNQPRTPLRGLNGVGAADWMLQNQVKGWAVEPVYSNGQLAQPQPRDFSAHEAAGVQVIVVWCYSAAKADGGLGTYPPRAEYDAFIQWSLSSILGSRGVWGHVLGHEPNRAGERPDFQDATHLGTPIRPTEVAYLYNAVWNHIPTTTRLSPPAIAPTNSETQDPREYFSALLKEIGGADFFALHAYSFAATEALDSNKKFSGMRWQYESFRMWEPFADVLFKLRNYATKPLIITETNHLYVAPGTPGWDTTDGATWIQRMYAYLQKWNNAPGDQYVYAACLYRLTGAPWQLVDQPALLQALKDNGEKAYPG